MSKETTANNETMNFSILKLAYEKQIQATIFHHDLAYKIFSWSNTILLAILGFSLSQSNTLTASDRVFLTCAVLILFLVVFIWQSRNRLESIEHAQNVARIDELFHLNTPGYFGGENAVIQRWHSTVPKWRAQFGIVHYNIAVCAMTIVVILALWR